MPVLVISGAWIVFQTLRGPFPNVFWHSFLRITEVEVARKAETFSFSWKKIPHGKTTVAKLFLDLASIPPRQTHLDSWLPYWTFGLRSPKISQYNRGETMREWVREREREREGWFVKLWGASSGSESYEWRDWQTEGPTSGWGSSWERFSFGSWFPTSVSMNVPRNGSGVRPYLWDQEKFV